MASSSTYMKTTLPKETVLIQGVYCLYTPPQGGEPDFDMVFIPGLKVEATVDQWWKTWTSRVRGEPGECWPQKWLPELFPRVRVLAISHASPGTPTKLFENGIYCINSLIGVGLGKRPYFLVGHSTGGLILKEVLLHASTRLYDSGVVKNCKGIVFYGVPHPGTQADLETLFSSGRIGTQIAHELPMLGEISLRRNHDFKRLSYSVPSLSFVETIEHKVGNERVLVVPASMAIFDSSHSSVMAIDADHFDVCRPTGKKSRDFLFLVEFIRANACAYPGPGDSSTPDVSVANLGFVPDIPAMDDNLGPGDSIIPDVSLANLGFVPDIPAMEDKLDVGTIAFAVARFLLQDETLPPLTIGFNAPWGHGKSSFMKFVMDELLVAAVMKRLHQPGKTPWSFCCSEGQMFKTDEARQMRLLLERTIAKKEAKKLLMCLRGALKHHWDVVEMLAGPNVLLVSFNSWRYLGQEEIWAGLAATIGKRLECAMGFRLKWMAILEYSWTRHFNEILLFFFIPGLIATFVLMLIAALAPKILQELGGKESALGVTAYPIAAVVWFALLYWRFFKVVRPVSSHIMQYVSDPADMHERHFGYQHNVMTDLQFLLRKVVQGRGMAGNSNDAGRPRVVVFVDDLDRCEDNKIVEVLQAINLVLGSCGFFTILGLDLDMVAGAIFRHYNGNDLERQRYTFEEARRFLRKIIQVPLELPNLSELQRKRYISTLLGPSLKAETPPADVTGTPDRHPGQQNPDEQTTLLDSTSSSTYASASSTLRARMPFQLLEPLLSWMRKMRLQENPSPPAGETLGGTDDTTAADYSTQAEHYDRTDRPAEACKEVFEAFGPLLPGNPRMLKQIVNYYRLMRIILSLDGNGVVSDKTLEKLAGWSVLVHVVPNSAAVMVQTALAPEHGKSRSGDAFSDICGSLDNVNLRQLLQSERHDVDAYIAVLEAERHDVSHMKELFESQQFQLLHEDVRRLGRLYGCHLQSPHGMQFGEVYNEQQRDTMKLVVKAFKTGLEKAPREEGLNINV